MFKEMFFESLNENSVKVGKFTIEQDGSRLVIYKGHAEVAEIDISSVDGTIEDIEYHTEIDSEELSKNKKLIKLIKS